jgi:hypothetical protein
METRSKTKRRLKEAHKRNDFSADISDRSLTITHDILHHATASRRRKPLKKQIAETQTKLRRIDAIASGSIDQPPTDHSCIRPSLENHADVSERKSLDLNAFRAFVKSPAFVQGYKTRIMILLGYGYGRLEGIHPGYIHFYGRTPRQNLSYIQKKMWSNQPLMNPAYAPFTRTVASTDLDVLAHFVECINIETWEVAWRMHPSMCTRNEIRDSFFELTRTSLMLNNSLTEHESWAVNDSTDYNDRRLELEESGTIPMLDENMTRRRSFLFRIMLADRKKHRDASQTELIKKETEQKLCPIFLSTVWKTWKQSEMHVDIPIHSNVVLNSPIATPFETGEWMVMDHPWHLFMDGQIISGHPISSLTLGKGEVSPLYL